MNTAVRVGSPMPRVQTPGSPTLVVGRNLTSRASSGAPEAVTAAEAGGEIMNAPEEIRDNRGENGRSLRV